MDAVWGAGGPWIVAGMCGGISEGGGGRRGSLEVGDVDLLRWSFKEAEGAKGVVEYGSVCREVGEGDSVLEVWGAGKEWGVRELES